MTGIDRNAEYLADILDESIKGESHGAIMKAFGYVLASMSLHEGVNFLDESMASVRAAADEYFAANKSQAFSYTKSRDQ